MKTATILTILKWVSLVFIAGFIGYFGKYLSKLIIARFSKKKENETKQSPTQAELDYKLEKKRLKQQQKTEKKKSKK
jgi:hypothetical protein